MGKIKWKSKKKIDEELLAQKATEKHRGKEFKTLSNVEKDALLKILCERAGLL